MMLIKFLYSFFSFATLLHFLKQIVILLDNRHKPLMLIIVTKNYGFANALQTIFFSMRTNLLSKHDML